MKSEYRPVLRALNRDNATAIKRDLEELGYEARTRRSRTWEGQGEAWGVYVKAGQIDRAGVLAEAVKTASCQHGSFERAASSLEEPEPCPDCDLTVRVCPACWKAGYRGEAPCSCHEARS